MQVESQLLSIEEDMSNYNRVKNLVVGQMIKEGYISQEEGEEFADRCQVIIYKGSWFSRWFDKHMKDSKKDGWYFKMIEMHEKTTSLDDLIRRTANGK